MLGAAIIVLNEDPYIDRCLSNIRGITNEIIVVDGGSTDKTIEICKKHSCKVVERPFDFDFSAQRNVALENSTCEWVIMIDADEFFTDTALGKIAEIAKENVAENSAYRIMRLDYLDGKLQGKQYQWRLLRKGSAVWEGKIHEGVRLLTGRSIDIPEDIPLMHCKDFRRQLYSDRLYENITNGELKFPDDENYDFSTRTFRSSE